MDPNDVPNAPKPAGPGTRFLLWIAGADEEILRQCPGPDSENVKAIALIMICVWGYQTALFWLVGNLLLSAPGAFRPDILIASACLATSVLAFDRFAVVRSGFYAQGWQELRRGGLDISGGWGVRIKAALFLAIRIMLSVCLAMLTAIFVSLLVFSADVTSQMHTAYLQADSALVADATRRVDHDIQRATEGANAEVARFDAMASQVAAARQSQLDPAGGDAQVRQAQKELDDLVTEKAKADAAVGAAETFATDELGGIKGAPGNSGQPGSGFRHKAAMERLADARTHAQDTAKQADAARSRLDATRKQRGAAGLATAQEAKEQLPQLEAALKDEEARLAAARDNLASLTQGREAAIRRSVEASPGYVPADTGLLAQLRALESVAGDDPKIKAVIILIDLTSFGFELAAVLAASLAYAPTTYAALLVANNYAEVVQIVDRLVQKIEQRPQQAGDAEITTPKPDGGADELEAHKPDRQPMYPAATADPFRAVAEEPIKRPRGRPRKTSLN